MALKLRVSPGDIITMSNGVQVTVKSVSDKVAELHCTAPAEIKIYTIFKDPAKQFKKLRKQEQAGTADKGQQLSPEEQRQMALKRINRGNPL